MKLVLENGMSFRGEGYGFSKIAYGEVVFNTSMTGFQEVLTDPSYAGQIVLFTYPHIGNTPVHAEDWEAAQVHCSAIVTRELPIKLPSWEKEVSLADFLKVHKKIALAGVDTRRITQLIRERGFLHGAILPLEMREAEFAPLFRKKWKPKLNKPLLYQEESFLSKDKHACSLRQKKLLLCDLGCKCSIIAALENMGYKLYLTNPSYMLESFELHTPDAVVLSNGAGDPHDYQKAIEATRTLIDRKIPILGICLGHQILALAYGAKVTKLRYGHHGINHPVLDLVSGEISITCQNHGYVVCRHSLPKQAQVTHISLFDNTIQGLSFQEGVHAGFQGHPEGGPGPTDVGYIFTKFRNVIERG